MSAQVTSNCPQCKQPLTIDEDQAELPATCSSCQTTFVPAVVIAESNRRFEMMMYIGMLVVGVGLVVYMAMTGNLKPKADAPENPPAAEAGAEG